MRYYGMTKYSEMLLPEQKSLSIMVVVGLRILLITTMQKIVVSVGVALMSEKEENRELFMMVAGIELGKKITRLRIQVP
jgi:hypothetical protein